MDRPIANACPDCNRPLDESPVYCLQCRTPAHQACFDERGACARPGCTGLRYRTAPGARGVRMVGGQGTDGSPALRTYSVDFTSTRETVALMVGVVATLIGGFLLYPYFGPKPPPMPMFAPLLVLALGIGAIAFRIGISDYRVFDGRERALWLYEVTFGSTRRTKIAPFDRFRGVVLYGVRTSRRVGSQRHRRTIHGLTWHVTVEMDRGRDLDITDREFVQDQGMAGGACPRDILAAANSVARLLGIQLREVIG